MRHARLLVSAVVAVLPFHFSQALASLREAAECGVESYKRGNRPCVRDDNGTAEKWNGSPGTCQNTVEAGGNIMCRNGFRPGDPGFSMDRVWSINQPWFAAAGTSPRPEPYCLTSISRFVPRPELGPERFKTCEIRKTRVELDAFIEQTNSTLPVYGSLYVSNRALIAKLTRNANALACLVKTWDGNPRHVDLVAEMKNSYKNLTDQEYSEAACRSDVPESIACVTDDVSEVCTAQRSVDTAREFIKSTVDEVTLLIGDVVPASDPAYRQRLESLAAEFAGYMK